MLERPEIRDSQIAACLQREYGLRVSRIAFLPLGADRDTAVFRVVADDETPYFLKLRSGVFDETSVALPRFLSDQGISQIIAPLATNSGRALRGVPLCHRPAQTLKTPPNLRESEASSSLASRKSRFPASFSKAAKLKTSKYPTQTVLAFPKDAGKIPFRDGN